jgi:hypothetical protein
MLSGMVAAFEVRNMLRLHLTGGRVHQGRYDPLANNVAPKRPPFPDRSSRSIIDQAAMRGMASRCFRQGRFSPVL